jgi:hypothetical protein
MNAKNLKGYVYLIWCQADGLFKIGKSKHPTVRRGQLQTGSASRLGLVCSIPAIDMHSAETALHRQYEHCKVSGEWYRLSWEQVADIRAMAQR